MSDFLYGHFKNGTMLQGPIELPDSFELDDGRTTFGFHTLEKLDPERLIELNWYKVDDPTILYNSDFESIVYDYWHLDDNILKRNHTILFVDWEVALTKAFNTLDKNRETYEISGFEYDYFGIKIKILTDRESSQPKLIAASVAINDGDRNDNDVWKFINAIDNSTIVIQLSNEELIKIKSFVFRKIQDSYNLQSQIAWQMLGTENTETLKLQIENGTINLNPWVIVSPGNELPWVY